MKNIYTAIVLLISLMTFVSQGYAEDGSVKVTNIAKKQVMTTNDKGEQDFDYVDPELAIPGDIIFYTTTFENIGSEPANNVVINNPIHSNLKYRQGSAQGDNTEIQFSIDGGASYDTPDKLFVTDKTGKKWAAKPEDYTSIRWIYKKPLLPGEKGTVTFRAMIR